MSKLLHTMRGHTDGVSGVAFFNDGHRVVTGSRDKTLRIWNAQRGTLLGEPLQGYQESVFSVAVSPDDRRVASDGQDNTVIIWDVERKQIAFKLVNHTGSVNCVCFSPEGKRIASGSNDGTAVIWDTKTGTVLTTLVGGGVWVLSVAFSPDGLKLASGAMDGIIRVCQTDNAELLLEFKAHTFGVCGIVWSPDGQQLISASYEKTVKFWNSSTGRQIGQPCTGHTDCIRSLAIASDGSFIATASDDKTVRRWSTEDFQQIGQPLEHPNKVLSVAISTNGALLASGTENEHLYLWSIRNTLQRRDGQEMYKEELEVEQQPRISEIEVLSMPASEVSISSQHCNDAQLTYSFHNLNVSSRSRDDTSTTSSGAHTVSKASSEHLFFDVAATVQPTRPRPVTKEQRNKAGYEAEGSDEDVFFDVPESPTETEEGNNRAGSEQVDSDEDASLINARTSSRLSLHASGVQSPFVTAPLPSQRQQRHDVPPSLMQVESNVSVLLQDLTNYITKIDHHPVARGGFGEIWKCIRTTDQGPVTVAVKSFPVYTSDASEVMEKKNKRIQRELRTCAKLKHPHILPVYGYTFSFGRFVAIVSPWAENGNLAAYVKDKDATLTIVRRFQILRDITAGLKYLHSEHVIHGDLTGPNVLIHADGTACLADFGLSLLYSEAVSVTRASYTSSIRGNLPWMAPELLGQSDNDLPVRPSEHSDIYSFGGIMLQALTSKGPYYYLKEIAVIRCIYNGEKPERSRYRALSEKYWDFIEECWSAATQDRPSTDRVVEVISNEFVSLSSFSHDSQQEVLPTPPAESNTHERTNSSAPPSSLEMSGTSLEIKQGRELALDKDEESAEDDEILDQSPTRNHPSSVSVEPAAISPTHNTSSALQMSFVQVESDSHSSVPAEAILQDLTALITKVDDFPVTRGGFGEVWKCIYQNDLGQTDVVVKSSLVYASDQSGEGMEKKIKRIMRELKIRARLSHPNILPVYGYTYGFGLLMAIVCPWAKNGNLTTYLEGEDATLTFVRRFEILRDVASGLQYLHANNIIHGDLTSPNVLIHGDGTACLDDFGLSLMYSEVITTSEASWTSSFHGNFRWLAPELLEATEDDLPVRPSKCSDIYSFGGIMLQVLTSRPPYYYLREAAVIQCVYAGKKPERSRYPPLSEKYWDFIEECWSAATQDRPPTDRVVEVISNEFVSLSSFSHDS